MMTACKIRRETLPLHFRQYWSPLPPPKPHVLYKLGTSFLTASIMAGGVS